jgi:hypothetical protein
MPVYRLSEIRFGCGDNAGTPLHARRSTMLLDTACRAVHAPYETERRFWEDART